ncbi:MAG: apolipoprotein N-acyltransferase, partial [Bdellovibrio sp. CG10_big_fil_rev_8_21_14_0_10_47_8]
MIDRFQKFFKLYRAPIFSGILIGTTYIPFPPWALAFCYMPLWYFALRKTSFGKQIFIGAWWTQFILTLIGFHWISFVSHSYGYFPWPVAIIVLLLFAAAVHLYIPLSLWLGHWLRQKFSLSEGATLITWALLLVLGEIFWPSIFRWNLGYTLLWIHS